MSGKRDLAKDLAICEDFKTRTFIPRHMIKGFVLMAEGAIRRAMEAEVEVERLTKQLQKIGSEKVRLREALVWVARHLPHDKKYGLRPCIETDMCITEYCLSCYAMAVLRRGEEDE